MFSVWRGRVDRKRTDQGARYFNYIIIRHAPESIYPNLILDSINVLEDEHVSIGTIIGTNNGTYLNAVSEDPAGNFWL